MENIKITAICNRCGAVTVKEYDESHTEQLVGQYVMSVLYDISKETGFKRMGGGKWLCPDCFAEFEEKRMSLENEYWGDKNGSID